ncbi:hypothetical protein FHG08_01310 [Pseudoalteromonas sp. Scap03]|uniref:restriction endonuclease subunit S n=1 Tax=unclassified Pseudoalteromonas TaxID=194690 RepID=UPI0015BA9061|nr:MULTISPECIES: restriction endonuclease subunit S [unclassified Pseudoalteromonas]NWL14426.1 hypothetical protein [Pseudoalteromonas sp. Scap03]QLE82439.1 hypothetical protein FLM54_13245 [Pseudoalteromonas sp. Scap25]QLE90381.1 hypothetical protein FLM47_13260 [Pseudoalteromonas sp. Scap06]
MSVIDQNIPKGFKQTEVGILPQEWQILTIDEAISSKMILDQMDGNHGELYPKSHEFKDDGIPYVGATDFYSGKIDYKHCKRLPIKRAKLFKKGVAKDGDVLFAHNATVGPSSLVETYEDFIIISTTATYYRCNGEEIKNTYLLNFFRSKLFESQYSSVMSQSTRNQVPILAQRKFYLALPHIKEQTAIANALSDVDALLTELEKLIAKKQAIKTATMQQLLTGKTRLPQFATFTEGEKQGQPKGTKPSELGEIPEDWEDLALGDVVCFVGGAQPEKNTFSYKEQEGYVRLIQIRDYKSDKHKVYIPSSLAKKTCSADDIMIGRYGPPIFQILRGIEGAYNVALIKAIPNEKIHKEFLYHFLKSDSLFELMDNLSQRSSGQTGVELSALKAYPIGLPNIEEQAAIATILSDMNNEIQTLKQRLAKTRQIKQGMMQELLTGRTRLPFDKEQ